MKSNFFKSFIGFAISIAIVGCSSGGSDMSAAESNALKSPGKSGPPKEASQDIAAQVDKQRKANEAAGVDDHGIPLSKSSDANAPAPNMNGGK